MNAVIRPTPSNVTVPAPRATVTPLPVRHIHRERDFGVGYGNSSGYASERRYAQNWMQPLFRCA